MAATPKTLEEQIDQVRSELDADENKLTGPALTLLIVAKLLHTKVYKNVSTYLRDGHL